VENGKKRPSLDPLATMREVLVMNEQECTVVLSSLLQR
jgi:hypothetical protein